MTLMKYDGVSDGILLREALRMVWDIEHAIDRLGQYLTNEDNQLDDEAYKLSRQLIAVAQRLEEIQRRDI